jgi:GT2 family glycosyltransferase
VKCSVIIVNYNVRHFLEQCLASVTKALLQIESEIIVVDNASVDDSVRMIRQLFPQVKCIESKINLGFAKANNLAVSQAKGNYILLLNPDTIVTEECFHKCIAFMDDHADAGALGVKMIDGSGHFLPESKRGFPDLWNSFCRMCGIYKLLPRSAVFNGYYAGQIDSNQINKVDVLSGAFMFIRKSVWDSIKGLDEDFFMYGEDIDLSYRIQKAGYSNYYFPGVTIVHYKGESTSKGSLNYVIAFYKAMILYTRKHVYGGNKWILISLLSVIVWLKAMITSVHTAFSALRLMCLDIAALAVGFYLIRYYWATSYHSNPEYYNNRATWYNLALFIIIWIACFFYQGVYEKKFSLKDLLIASIWGFVFSLMIYALLPETWRASRMLLVLSFLWVIIYSMISRLILHRIHLKSWIIGSDKKLNVLIIGDELQVQQAKILLNQKRQEFNILQKDPEEIRAYSISQWNDFIRINHVEEFIFCQKNFDWKYLLEIMKELSPLVNYKIMSESGAGIIGSPSKNNKGEIYSLDLDYNLSQKVYIRQKRLFDLMFSLVLLSFSWLFVFVFNNKKQYLKNILRIIMGKLTWVSYHRNNDPDIYLPLMKPGILYPVPSASHVLSGEFETHLLSMYAWNYSVWSDLEICLRDFQKLDHEPT